MVDLIIIAAAVLIVSLSTLYIVRKKKKGVKCIGCPGSCQCCGKCPE